MYRQQGPKCHGDISVDPRVAKQNQSCTGHVSALVDCFVRAKQDRLCGRYWVFTVACEETMKESVFITNIPYICTASLKCGLISNLAISNQLQTLFVIIPQTTLTSYRLTSSATPSNEPWKKVLVSTKTLGYAKGDYRYPTNFHVIPEKKMK